MAPPTAPPQETTAPEDPESPPPAHTDDQLLGMYGSYFADALSSSPTVHLESVVVLYEDETGHIARKADVTRVAQVLHDMMQCVFDPTEEILYI